MPCRAGSAVPKRLSERMIRLAAGLNVTAVEPNPNRAIIAARSLHCAGNV